MIQVKSVSKRYALSRKQQRELQTTDSTVNAVTNVSFTCNPGSVYLPAGAERRRQDYNAAHDCHAAAAYVGQHQC